jgi:two-component SAPR family response regulator
MANLLVVDDEAALLKLVVAILERAGHTVRSFPRATLALDALTQFIPDAIVSDISMPLMDGLEFCAQVRSRPHLQAVPFIFLSALGERNEIRAGMNTGADDYLIKPFSPSELLEALEARLKRSTSLRSQTPHTTSSLLQVRALGGVGLTFQGTEVQWGSKKAAEFFFFLLEHPQGVTTWEVAEALWPDKDENKAASVFHTTLHRLRKMLEFDVVFTKNRRYFFNTDLEIQFDVREYLEVSSQARETSNLSGYERAVSLYGGPYLSGFDAPWCEDKREMLHSAHLGLLLDAGRLADGTGNARLAAWFTHLATQHEQYSEQAWNELARLYDAMGDSRRASDARGRISAWDD